MVIGYGLLVIEAGYWFIGLLVYLFIGLLVRRLIVIQFDEAEEHRGEGPEGGAAVADEG